MCLSMNRFQELVNFTTTTGLKMVFGLNAVWGRPNHSLNNPLNLSNIEALLAYAAQHMLHIHGFELGNEKCGPPPALFAADYHNLAALLVKYWPDKSSRPLLIGNDCNTNPSYLASFLPLVADVLDVTTYHRYDGCVQQVLFLCPD
jgi:heparanase 1